MRGGSSEYLKGFLSEYIYEQGNTHALAYLMKKIEAHPPLLLVEKASRWVKRELNWPHVVQKTIDLYEQALNL